MTRLKISGISFSYSHGLVLILLLTATTALANNWDTARVEYAGDKSITVYRSAYCDCCHKWIKHLQTHGFDVQDKTVTNPEMTAFKENAGVPRQLASCHTAVIEGYAIEGHVPADDIKQLLIDRPAITGLSVPQMPVGTPGMEAGDRKDPFAVIQFSPDQAPQIYRRYSDY